jgi:hypothetical protein
MLVALAKPKLDPEMVVLTEPVRTEFAFNDELTEDFTVENALVTLLEFCPTLRIALKLPATAVENKHRTLLSETQCVASQDVDPILDRTVEEAAAAHTGSS